ncbi:hypothetical protein [Streptomyces sp. ISL-94]|nr:hypothetical protein [Streptomyces sp. ISL-94]MBT2480759.1 hypothetical protein [Streptomyces sp. ISL-94]
MKLKFVALSLISLFSIGGLGFAASPASAAVPTGADATDTTGADDIIWH